MTSVRSSEEGSQENAKLSSKKLGTLQPAGSLIHHRQAANRRFQPVNRSFQVKNKPQPLKKLKLMDLQDNYLDASSSREFRFPNRGKQKYRPIGAVNVDAGVYDFKQKDTENGEQDRSDLIGSFESHKAHGLKFNDKF